MDRTQLGRAATVLGVLAALLFGLGALATLSADLSILALGKSRVVRLHVLGARLDCPCGGAHLGVMVGPARTGIPKGGVFGHIREHRSHATARSGEILSTLVRSRFALAARSSCSRSR